MIPKTEAEVASHFISWFESHEIYKEVEVPGGCVDFVACLGRIRIAVEVKKSLNQAVMEQAYRNRMYFHYSYVATPMYPTRFQRMLCRILQLGVITGDFRTHGNPYVSEQIYPVLNRRPIRVKLEEYQKRSVAGCVHGRETAFTNTVREIKQFLCRHGPTPLKKLLSKENHYHWSTPYSARNCLVDLVRRGIIKGIQIQDGTVSLIPENKEL